MAEQETNQSPEERTRTTEFPEAKGKIIQSIQVYVAADHYSANINFTDNTAIVLSMEPSIAMFPLYGDWATGERKIIKEWKPIQSISLRQ